MTELSHRAARGMALAASLVALSACSNPDWDLRGYANGFSTTGAVRTAAAARPTPDSRGVISYQSYQVAVARRGDTVSSIASRLGLDAVALARYNGLETFTALREGEVLALPTRVAEAPFSGAATGGPAGGDGVDVTAIATSALDRAAGSGGTPTTTTTTLPPPAAGKTGPEPVRHQVARGETAYSIARLYNVPVKALADWNGLGPDLSVREGQYLIIPLVTSSAPPPADTATSAPGKGSVAPEPPSAAKPLPDEKTLPAATPTPVPPSPDLGKDRTAASAATLAMPVDGRIIRAYDKKKKIEGIDISATAGSPVKAAADGTVAAVTQDTKKVPVILIRHPNGLITIYANVASIKVAKGASVKRGQTIATVAPGNPAFMHFEVLKGAETVDPAPYLQ